MLARKYAICALTGVWNLSETRLTHSGNSRSSDMATITRVMPI